MNNNMENKKYTISNIVRKVTLPFVLIALVGVGGLTSCASSSDSSDGIISFRGCTPQANLLPTNTNETCGGDILGAVTSGLVYYDGQETKLDQAESIEPNADASEYTIKIKPDIKFANGDPVTVEDYINSWSFGAAKPNAQLSSSFFDEIVGSDELGSSDTFELGKTILSGLKKVDDQTFTVKLKEPDSIFKMKLGYYAYSPVPTKGLQNVEEFTKLPYYTGPYKLTRISENEVYEVRPNEYYNGPLPAKNGGIDFKVYTSDEAAYADIKSGLLDFMKGVPQSAYKTFQTEPNTVAFNEPGSTVNWFGISYAAKHFGNDEEGKLRRKAISMAIDRDELCKTIFSDTATPCKDFATELVEGYDPNIPGSDVLKYNASKAKELWEEADAISPWTDSDSFKFAYNADASHKEWVDAVCNSIKSTLGITALGDPIPTFSDFRSRITQRSLEEAMRCGWQPDYPHVETYITQIFASWAGHGNGSNDVDYNNPKVDQLIHEALSTTDESKVVEKFKEIEKILYEDLPVIPVFSSDICASASSAIQQDSVKFNFNTTLVYSNVIKN